MTAICRVERVRAKQTLQLTQQSTTLHNQLAVNVLRFDVRCEELALHEGVDEKRQEVVGADLSRAVHRS